MADTSNKNATKALLRAAQTGEVKHISRSLLDGADINAVDEHGNTVLMHACFYGHHDFVKALLKCDPPPNVHAVNRQNDSSLTLAAGDGNLEILRILLRQKPPPDVLHITKAGKNALDLAEALGNEECVEFLKHKIEVYKTNNPDFVDPKDTFVPDPEEETKDYTSNRPGRIQIVDVDLTDQEGRPKTPPPEKLAGISGSFVAASPQDGLDDGGGMSLHDRHNSGYSSSEGEHDDELDEHEVDWLKLSPRHKRITSIDGVVEDENTRVNMPEFIAMAKEGVVFLKHTKSAGVTLGRRPSLRLIRLEKRPNSADYDILTWTKPKQPNKEPKIMKLKNVRAVTPGKTTSTFTKHSKGDKKGFPSSDSNCFSVISKNRSLDLQAKNEVERDKWVLGLRQLIADFQENKYEKTKKSK